MDSKIVIFEGNKNDGCFSKSKKFYKEGLTDKEIFESIKKDRINLGKKYGFDGLKMFQVEQKEQDSDIYPDNKSILINEKHMKKDDFFKEHIKTDILLITKDYPGVVLCHRTGDCPVLIAEDRKQEITGIVHTSIYHVNRGLAKGLIDCLVNKYHSNPKDIYLYIGSHIKKDSYVYNNYPPQATSSEIWRDAITEDNGKYKIDLEKAILNQLKNYDLGEIKISKIDTATDPNYASHRKANEGIKSKKGQNIVGFYYK